MDKSPDAFRTISEVSDWLETPAHVLRFWETRFTQLKPVKRAGGRRYYRPGDMALLGGIKRLLHDDGMTIRGVQKILRERGVRYVAGLGPVQDVAELSVLTEGDADAFSRWQADAEAEGGVQEAPMHEDATEQEFADPDGAVILSMAGPVAEAPAVLPVDAPVAGNAALPEMAALAAPMPDAATAERAAPDLFAPDPEEGPGSEPLPEALEAEWAALLAEEAAQREEPAPLPLQPDLFASPAASHPDSPRPVLPVLQPEEGAAPLPPLAALLRQSLPFAHPPDRARLADVLARIEALLAHMADASQGTRP